MGIRVVVEIEPTELQRREANTHKLSTSEVVRRDIETAVHSHWKHTHSDWVRSITVEQPPVTPRRGW